ncbi:MAG: penicillin-binding protein 2 [Proteobacteria bacterium]|nr:penicillin-binding protein 2 [Pseudomonadota bacterium]
MISSTHPPSLIKSGNTAVRHQSPLHHRRFFLVECLVYLGFTLILARAFVIQMFPPSEESLKRMASKQYSTQITLGNYRGTIFDRRNIPLALSVKKPSLAVNPRVFSPTEPQMEALHQILGTTPENIRLIADKKSYFSWLARHTTLAQAERVLSLDIPGVYSVREPARYYPTGEMSGPVIGKVNIDNHGLFGLERLFDHELSGGAGQLSAVRDGKGQLILDNFRQIKPRKPGLNVHLSLDGVIQEIVYEELSHGIKEADAKSGFALMGDPYTGAILAAVSLPSFNPNQSSLDNMENTKNRGVTDLFEPGSIVKPFVVAEALKRHITTINTPYFFSLSGIYYFKGGRVRDDHPKKELNTAEILIHSSNIGMLYLAERLGKDRLYDIFSALNIGGKALLVPGISAIARSTLSKPDTWHNTRFANVSFGQGFSMTGLEVLQAYNVIASGGKLSPLHLITKITTASGALHRYRPIEHSTTLYPTEVMRDVSHILHRVSIEGTGRQAASQLYRVAGKTGTSEKFDTEIKAYSPDKRIASFAGFAPYPDPKITLVVFIDEPKNKPYYGGKWAAPVFRRIVDRVLPYLNVLPNQKSSGATLAQKKDATATNQ